MYLFVSPATSIANSTDITYNNTACGLEATKLINGAARVSRVGTTPQAEIEATIVTRKSDLLLQEWITDGTYESSTIVNVKNEELGTFYDIFLSGQGVRVPVKYDVLGNIVTTPVLTGLSSKSETSADTSCDFWSKHDGQYSLGSPSESGGKWLDVGESASCSKSSRYYSVASTP